MAKVRGVGWEQQIIARTTGKRCQLETLEGFYIIPKKLSYEAMQKIFQLNKIEVDPDKITGENVEEVQEKVKEEVKKIQKSGKNIFLESNLLEIARVTFLYGVESHNFFSPVYVRETDGTIKRDEDGDMLAEEDADGKPRMVKSPWDEETYQKIVDRDFQIVMEIYKHVMRFSSTAKKKTSKK